MTIKSGKFSEWVGRYTYPIMVATVAEILSAVLVYYIFENLVLSAVVATAAGNVAFYLCLAYRDLQQRRNKDRKITLGGVFKVARNLLIEFGPAEYLDTYISRPFLLVVCPLFISPYLLGATVGSLLAEFLYAVFVISSYELRKKGIRD